MHYAMHGIHYTGRQPMTIVYAPIPPTPFDRFDRFHRLPSRRIHPMPHTVATEDVHYPTCECTGICAICLEYMETGMQLPCTHIFHEECVRSWISEKHSCPTCRSIV